METKDLHSTWGHSEVHRSDHKTSETLRFSPVLLSKIKYTVYPPLPSQINQMLLSSLSFLFPDSSDGKK